MRLCRVQNKKEPAIAVFHNDSIYLVDHIIRSSVPLESQSDSDNKDRILEIAMDKQLQSHIRTELIALKGEPESKFQYLPPITGPIVGIGRNYKDHVGEGNLQTTDRPKLFFKHPNSLIGANQKIIIPKSVAKADWEAELGVVIGKRASKVPESEALDYVAGFTNINDVSAREFQFDLGPAQTSFAKSMDGFCPSGPWLVTTDEIEDCQNLSIRCYLNSHLVQESSTDLMIFSIKYIISYISQVMTLEPGSILCTGTPQGVGHFMQPPRYLGNGDIVTVEVQGLGSLSNTFVKEGSNL